MVNYYKVLNIKEEASNEEIKRAFRTLAKIYHPDKKHEDASVEKFNEISEAKNFLLDVTKRKILDDFLRKSRTNRFNVDKTINVNLTQQDLDNCIFYITIPKSYSNKDLGTRRISIKITPGTKFGNVIRVKGYGMDSVSGADIGDLVITLNERNVYKKHVYKKPRQDTEKITKFSKWTIASIALLVIIFIILYISKSGYFNDLKRIPNYTFEIKSLFGFEFWAWIIIFVVTVIFMIKDMLNQEYKKWPYITIGILAVINFIYVLAQNGTEKNFISNFSSLPYKTKALVQVAYDDTSLSIWKVLAPIALFSVATMSFSFLYVLSKNIYRHQ